MGREDVERRCMREQRRGERERRCIYVRMGGERRSMREERGAEFETAREVRRCVQELNRRTEHR